MKVKNEQLEVEPQTCLACGKSIHAPYGRWLEGWTCSAKCNNSFYNGRERYKHPSERRK